MTETDTYIKKDGSDIVLGVQSKDGQTYVILLEDYQSFTDAVNLSSSTGDAVIRNMKLKDDGTINTTLTTIKWSI